MSVTSLLADTALSSEGDGVYEQNIPEAWAGTAGIVGGYSLAIICGAVNDHISSQVEPTADQRLVSLTTSFLRPVAPGPVLVVITPIRVGRSVSFWQVELRSSDRVALQATATTCRPLSDAEFHASAPHLPERPRKEEPPWDPSIGMPAHDQFWFWPRRSYPAQDAGWILPRGAAPNDARLVAMVSDIWLPPVLGRLDRPATVVGLTHSLHLHTPAIAEVVRLGDPLFVALSTDVAVDGTVDETIQIRSVDGVLVATTHQVRLLVPLG